MADPIVNLSLSTDTAIESEGTVVTFNFDVEGDIPEGGLATTLNIGADSPLWITDFNNFSRTGADEDGNIQSLFILREPVGFGGEISSFSGSVLVRDVPLPFDSIPIILTENEASFELTVFDDILEEGDEVINFSVGDSDSVPLTVQDGVEPGAGPTIGVTIEAEADVLVEDLIDQNTLTLTFDVEGEIPDGGVEFLLESDTFDILGDFDIGSIVTEGFSSDGRFGGIAPVELGRGFTATILEDGATLTVDVANDGIEEGEQTIDFTLADGELYNVNPDASTVSVDIIDPTPTFSEGSKKGGTGQGDEIIGETNNEEIDARGGDDFVDGNLGNDTIIGGNGDDTLFGNDGNDSIIGGKGDDLIESGLAGFADFADGGIGNDTIIGGITEDGEFVASFGNTTFLGGSGEDFIQGGGQRATLEGGNGDDTIFGGGNDSVLDGGKGDDYLEAVGSTTGSGIPNFSDDTLTGGDGNDTLIAFADDDVLDGGTGNDILDGGLNEDTLTGGANQDIFVFRANDGDEIDIVTDFEVGVDQIGLDGLTFEDLSFSAGDSGLAMNLGDETLAVFEGVDALDADDFTVAPDFA